MAKSNCGVLSRLPNETVFDIYQYLDEATLYGSLPCVSKAFLRCGKSAPRRRATFTLRNSSAVNGIRRWLSVHGQHVQHLKLVATAWDPTTAPIAKAALWAGLSNPANTQRLCSLQLDMPFTPDDEAAVIGAVCASTPTLRSLQLHYQRPLSHARRASAVCFCTHSSPTLWSGAAAHLRELRITGACLCNMRGVVQLSNLETLEVSCCNAATAAQEFCSVLQSLPKLGSFSYTTSKPTLLSLQTAHAIAAASNLTHLELGNFVLPMCSGSAVLCLDAAVVPPAAAAAAEAAAGPCRMQLAQLLSHLCSLRLVDCSGVAASLPVFGGLTQLTSFAVVRSTGHGSFMPVLSQFICSDSDSETDSDIESETHSIDSDDEELGCSDSSSGSGYLVASVQGDSSSGSYSCSTPTRMDAAATSAGQVVAWDNPVRSSRRQKKRAAALSSLGLLYNLQELDLRGFELHSITPICSLQQLKVLKLGPASGSNLGGCRDSSSMGELTTRGLAGIVSLQELEFLDVSYNRLTADCLPLLAVLTKLTYLDLAGNSLGGSISRCSSSCSCEECQLLCSTLQDCGLEGARSCGSKHTSKNIQCCSNSDNSTSLVALDACSKPVVWSDSLGEFAAACRTAVAAGPWAGCGVDSAIYLTQEEEEQLLLADGSSCFATRIPAAVAATAAVAAASAPLAAASRPYLKHLDISGCGLSRLTDAEFDLSGLTCLRAGTALVSDGRGHQVTQTNSLSACTVATLCNLKRLQDLEVAASTPSDSKCYSGLAALTAVTRLVLQDPNAAEGLFGAFAAAANPAVDSSSTMFRNLQELGLVVSNSSARSSASTAAVQQLVSRCKGLTRLSLFPQHVDDAAPQGVVAFTADPAAELCCAGGQQDKAANEDCCTGGGCCSIEEQCAPLTAAQSACCAAVAGPPEASKSSASAQTVCAARCASPPVADKCSVGVTLERVGSGCSGISRCSSPSTTGCGSSSADVSCVSGVAAALCSSKCTPVSAGCCSKKGLGVEAGWYGALAGLSGLTRLDIAVPDELSLITGALSGLSRLRHLQLLPGCQDSLTVAAAAGTVASCCSLQPAGCLSLPAGFSSASRRYIGDGELMGLSALTSLSHLDLSQIGVNDAAVDELQLLLPCTKITVAARGHARLFA